MRVVIIGADGQLGSDLLRAFPRDTVVPLFWPDFDLTRRPAAARALAKARPDIVINTAAFHRVDECEEAIGPAFEVNAFAVRDLARLGRELGAVLVHFSTDYVFDGQKRAPYVEEDPPAPHSVYAASKLAGELFLQATGGPHFLIRTCGLFGLAGCREKGMNFVETMLHLDRTGRRPIRVVDDQIVTPTSTRELADRVADLVRTEAYGLYHLTNEGSCSWFEFARRIFGLLGREASLEPVSTAAFGSKARRPAYSVLDKGKMKALGLTPFSSWEKALEDYLNARGLLPRGETGSTG
jgi:dTDP-4-dehydrorhamnose reductase